MKLRHFFKSASLKRQLVGSSMLMIAVISVALGFFSYFMARDAIVNVMGNKVLIMAEAFVTAVDADEFKKLQRPEDMESAYYQELQSELNRLRKQTGLTYLYTMSLDAEGNHLYVVDGTDMDSENFSALGDVENELCTALLKSFEGGSFYDFTADRWGQMISAFTPIVDSEGKIAGILAVDFDVTDMVDHLSRLRLLILAVVLVILAATFFLQSQIARQIVTPIHQLTEIAGRLAEGEMDIQVAAGSDNEIGRCMQAFGKMADNMRVQAGLARTIAEGDLTTRVRIRSDKDALNIHLDAMVQRFLYIVERLSAMSRQLTAKCGVLTDKSAAIAQGATEQAGAIQELNASVEEISGKTRQNARRAQESTQLTDAVQGLAESGNLQMTQMLGSMREISESSRNIENIIKTIDSIAQQTNILSLNASIEAARAGAAGRGFSVVAEEVRSLAIQSAAAAKDTAQIIEHSILQVENGMKTAEQTARSLSQITLRIGEAADISRMISDSSQEQAAALEQIRAGLSQVSAVVQSSAAATEDSAAAATELARQAGELEEVVRVFRLK